MCSRIDLMNQQENSFIAKAEEVNDKMIVSVFRIGNTRAYGKIFERWKRDTTKKNEDNSYKFTGKILNDMEIIDLINPDNDAIIISPSIVENQTNNKKSVRFDRSITEYFFTENQTPDEIRFMFLADKCDKVPSTTTTTTTTTTTLQMSSNGNERNEQLKVPINMNYTISNIQSDDCGPDHSNNSINDNNVNISNSRSNSSIDDISDINVSKRKQNRSDSDKTGKKRKQNTPLKQNIPSTTGYGGVIDEEQTQTYGVEVRGEFNQILWSGSKFATATEAARAYDDYISTNNLENKFELNFKRNQTTKNAFNITKDNNKWFIDDKIDLLLSNNVIPS